MNNRILLFSFLIITFLYLYAGDGGIELIHADKSIGKMIDDERVNISEGNVHFRQDTIDMYCDEARFYESQNKVEFIGSVYINDGHNTLRARRVDYYSEERKAVCIGRVRIKTPKDSLYAEHFTYNFKTGEATGRTNLFIFSIEDNVKIWGERGRYDRNKGFSLIRNNCRLTRYDENSADTLIILSQQMEYYELPSKKAVALDSVIIFQGSLKAVCDTAEFHPDQEIIWLKNKPRAWYELSKMKGKRMRIDVDSLKLRNITIYEDALAESQVDSVSPDYNSLQAREIQFYIENKKPEKIIAVDNASSIYYLLEENERQGSNYATADTIVVYFQQGELDSIDVRGGAQGTFYPDDYKGEKSFD